MLLNVRSEYSLLNSTLRLKDYITTAKEKGYEAIGLADTHVLHGGVRFYKEAQAIGLKPLIGLHIHVGGLIRQEKNFECLIYAKTALGYKHLMKLSRIVEEAKQSPVAFWQYIEHSATDLVYISVGSQSEIEQALTHDDVTLAEQVLHRLQQVFQPSNIYLGTPIYPLNQTTLAAVTRFAKEHDLPQVIGQLVNSLKEDEAFSLQILQAIEANESLSNSLRYAKGTHYIYDRQQLEDMYRQIGREDILVQTQSLVEKLNVSIDLDQSYLPRFKVPAELTASDYLRQLCQERLQLLELTDNRYQDRLNHELAVITQMQFADYFLIVWDILQHAHRQGIRVGPGRGSAAGSLVSYLLQITQVDPITYDLLFERFLNPERYNMPDIDIDIPDNKRQEVLHFIQQTYGYEAVAQIMTLGTFGAKAAIRDTLRVVGASAEELRRWSKSIPSDQNQLMTLERAYSLSGELQALVNESETNSEIYQAARTIEGLPRHTSTHAAAVVISDFPLERVIPVKDRPSELLLTQLDMHDVEGIGLLKMDFLGLRNLAILDSILKSVKRLTGEIIDPQLLDMNDELTLALFRQADTNGIFQFESDGIKRVLRKLNPSSFEDIVAVNALYRPGPMKQIDHFIARKEGREPINYTHPVLEPILKNTYGIIVYQEQVMNILVEMAGFTLGQADILRRAMGKKQADVMQAWRERFIQGTTANGYSKEQAEQVYNYIYEFSNYGFNRAHAVVYSTLAYQLAYLKAHYPQAFYQALLNSGNSQSTSYNSYIKEAKERLGRLLALDINRSVGHFSVDEGVRLGFYSVKGMRKELVSQIISERTEHGLYKSLLDFLRRMPKKWLKEEWIAALISAGAFDNVGDNRHTHHHNLKALLKAVEFSGESMNLFQELEPKIEWVPDYSLIEKLNQETEILGFAVSGHPLEAYNTLYQQGIFSVSDIEDLAIKQRVSVLAFIQGVKTIRTKNNDLMAFVTFTNEFHQVEGVVFPEVYQRYHDKLNELDSVVVEGTISLSRRNKKQLTVQRIEAAQQLLERGERVQVAKPYQRCFIKVRDFAQEIERINELKALAINHMGPCDIILVDHQRQTIQLDKKYAIGYSQSLQASLNQLFGEKNVIFK